LRRRSRNSSKGAFPVRHSDQSCQYRSHRYVEKLRAHGLPARGCGVLGAAAPRRGGSGRLAPGRRPFRKSFRSFAVGKTLRLNGARLERGGGFPLLTWLDGGQGAGRLIPEGSAAMLAKQARFYEVRERAGTGEASFAKLVLKSQNFGYFYTKLLQFFLKFDTFYTKLY
jgi:hypothetical protein